LTFPDDHAVGEVVFLADGKRSSTVPATGRIDVPPGVSVQLVLTSPVRDVTFDGIDTDVVASVVLQHRKLGDDLLQKLGSMVVLRELRAVNTAVTDAGAPGLAAFTELRVLNLRGTRVTDSGVRNIAGLTELRSLNLAHTRITGAALEVVGTLRGLMSLSLAGTKISGDDLRHISGLTELRSLDLQGLAVTDDDLKHLAGMTSLRGLLLRSTQVTAEGLLALPHSPNVEVVTSPEMTGDIGAVRAARPDLIVNGYRRRVSSATPATSAPRGVTWVTADDFSEQVLDAPFPVLVDFWADWCVPCKRLDPVIDEVSYAARGAFAVKKIDTEAAPAIADRYGVMSIPALLVFANGEEILRFSRANAKDIVAEVLGALGTPSHA
jgi:thioredoxin